MQTIRFELEKLSQNGQIRSIPDIQTKNGNKIIIDNKEYINFASNDYLNIGANLELQKEFIEQFKYEIPLLSSASARLLTGSSQEFKNLETTLADLFQREACLIFNTGYQCNLGVISTLVGKGDVVFSDKLNHASIIDGMRLAEGDFYRYKHFDYENLEKLLKEKRNSYKRAIIVTESVFSMDGDIVDIQKIIELKKKYNCLLMVDEAHAFCAVGDYLTGICGRNPDVDIVTATFGKSVGSFGAFCVANKDIISYLINKARSFIFSTSIPPLNIAWSNWLLTNRRGYLEFQKNKLENLIKDVHLLLEDKGIMTPSNTQIIPIIIGENHKTLLIAEKLKSLGFYIPAIRPPTVPVGTSRLRISLTVNTNVNDFKQVLSIV